MQLISRWVVWIGFITFSIYLNTVVWGITYNSIISYIRYDIIIGIPDILRILNPLVALLGIVMLYQFSFSCLTCLILFWVSSFMEATSRVNPYLRYGFILIGLYLILVAYNAVFNPDIGYPLYSLLDDFTSQRSKDLDLLIGYFLGNTLFFLIYIPIWNTFLHWMRRKQ